MCLSLGSLGDGQHSILGLNLGVALILLLVPHQCELLDVPQTGVGLGQLQVVFCGLPGVGVLTSQIIELLLDNYFIMKPEIGVRCYTKFNIWCD